ncbi:uncharacterized protein LOC122320492 [Drosophila ficusphila]|uniref:uncharacterized protein LOC122320492 n=1 Tax=Drosophila ficusphila TaxID=30025 RepID=UPI001C8A5893|nr:uncharacterized protein LOC122320492 [Drosophila ficusphila]
MDQNNPKQRHKIFRHWVPSSRSSLLIKACAQQKKTDFPEFSHCGYDGSDLLSLPTVQTDGFRDLCYWPLPCHRYPREGNNHSEHLHGSHNKNKQNGILNLQSEHGLKTTDFGTDTYGLKR